MHQRPVSTVVVTVLAAVVAALAGALVLSATNAGAGPGDVDTTYVPVQPCRLFDLRPNHEIGDRSSPLGPGEVYTQQVTGAVGGCTVPADASGVMMNVTIMSPTEPSHLTIFPADLTTVPNVASLNWVAGQPPTPNAVDAKLSPDGKLKFRNLNGQVYVLADVVGYHTSASLKSLSADIAQRVIPGGETVTGNIDYSSHATTNPYFDSFAIDLPGTAPTPLDNDDVNFPVGWLDGDAACTGTPESPTAPPGKVCIYPAFTSNFGTHNEVAGGSATLRTRGFAVNIVVDGVDLEPSEANVILRGSWAYTAP